MPLLGALACRRQWGGLAREALPPTPGSKDIPWAFRIRRFQHPRGPSPQDLLNVARRGFQVCLGGPCGEVSQQTSLSVETSGLEQISCGYRGSTGPPCAGFISLQCCELFSGTAHSRVLLALLKNHPECPEVSDSTSINIVSQSAKSGSPPPHAPQSSITVIELYLESPKLLDFQVRPQSVVLESDD